MKVHIIVYTGEVVGVYSSRGKLLRAYVSRCERYKVGIVGGLRRALEDIYRSEYSEYDPLRDIGEEAIEEILNLFTGEPYDPKKFTYKELQEATDPDYSFVKKEIDILKK